RYLIVTGVQTCALPIFEGAKDHALTHPDQPAPPHGLHHLRIEQLRYRHPPGLRRGAFGLAAWWLDPLAAMGQQRGGILLEAIGRSEERRVGKESTNQKT